MNSPKEDHSCSLVILFLAIHFQVGLLKSPRFPLPIQWLISNTSLHYVLEAPITTRPLYYNILLGHWWHCFISFTYCFMCFSLTETVSVGTCYSMHTMPIPTLSSWWAPTPFPMPSSLSPLECFPMALSEGQSAHFVACYQTHPWTFINISSDSTPYVSVSHNSIFSHWSIYSIQVSVDDLHSHYS